MILDGKEADLCKIRNTGWGAIGTIFTNPEFGNKRTVSGRDTRINEIHTMIPGTRRMIIPIGITIPMEMIKVNKGKTITRIAMVIGAISIHPCRKPVTALWAVSRTATGWTKVKTDPSRMPLRHRHEQNREMAKTQAIMRSKRISNLAESIEIRSGLRDRI